MKKIFLGLSIIGSATLFPMNPSIHKRLEAIRNVPRSKEEQRMIDNRDAEQDAFRKKVAHETRKKSPTKKRSPRRDKFEKYNRKEIRKYDKDKFYSQDSDSDDSQDSDSDDSASEDNK